MKEFFLDFFSIVPGAVALGALLDVLLLEPATKSALEAALTRAPQRNRLASLFYAYLELINKGFFVRFFNAKFLSWRSFKNASLLSCIFLISVTTGQYFYDARPFVQIEPSLAQIAIVLICILANFIIDWVSFGLTQMFFSVSAASKNIWHSVILIVVDVIITINIFALSYAVPITLTLLIADQSPRSSELAISQIADLSPTKSGISDERVEFLPKQYWIGSPLYASPWGPGLFTYYANSKTITLPVALDSLKSLGLHLEKNEDFLVPANLNAYDYPPRKKISRSSKDWARLENSDQWTKITLYRVHAEPTVTLRKFNAAYTTAYIYSEQAQQAFPSNISGKASFVNLGTIYQQYSRFKNQDGDYLRLCAASLDSSWKLTDNNELHSGRCAHRILFPATSVGQIDGSMTRMRFNLDEVLIPLNTTFMTSIAITVFLYMALVLLVIARIIKSTLLNGASKYRTWFLKAPFSTTALAVGLVIFGLVEII